MRRFLLLLLAVLMASVFSSCYYFDAGMENLLVPPKLTDGQNEIYKVLENRAGTGISLKYPRTGDYRSAFVIENIDDEPGKEAMVFYQNNVNVSNTAALTVSVLDKEDGEWVPVYDIAAAGSDVDQVAFSSFGTQNNMFIIIGYALTSETDKVLHIYRYRDGIMQDLFNCPYSLFEVVDIDDNGYPELVTLSPAVTDKGGQITAAKANVIRYQNGGFVTSDSVDMDSSITSYVNIQTGYIGSRQTALYLDGMKGQNKITTQILFYQDGKLQNNAFLDRTATDQLTRQAGNLSMDIDGDGVIEIPVPELMPGYQIATNQAEALKEETDPLYFTRWQVYSNGEFVEKYFSYLNIGLGYTLTIPQNMQNGTITAKRETAAEQNGDEIIFYLFEESLEQSTQELFRICVINQADIDESLDGYERIETSGQLAYFVRTTPLARELYQLDTDMIRINFTLLNDEDQ